MTNTHRYGKKALKWSPVEHTCTRICIRRKTYTEVGFEGVLRV